MIIEELLEKPYEEYTLRSDVWLQCDYCGIKFKRCKKTRERLLKNVKKDSCASKECSRKKREESFKEKYGATNIFETEFFKNKQQETNEIKYGTKEYFSSEDFKNKRKNTLVEKFGVESPLQNEEIRKKVEDTCERLYGVRNYSQAEDYVEKIKNTSKEKYGCDFPMQSPEIKNKRDETCIERYGCKNYTQTEEYLKNRKERCLEKHGVEHESQLPEIRLKVKQTCQEKYGVDSYSKLPIFKERVRKTCEEKYGKSWYTQTEEYKEKCKKKCLEKYGVEYVFQAKEVIEKSRAKCLELYGSTNPAAKSKTENEISDWLASLGYEFKYDREILKGKEIDLFNKDLGLGIEYCGLFWHNELSKTPRGRGYHYDKYAVCYNNNVRLITIFEDEWKKRESQCKSIIKSIIGKFDQRIYARKCSVVEINKKDCINFCKHYHLKDTAPSVTYAAGLIFDGSIVGVMSMGRHHRNNENSDIVLTRMCFRDSLQVVGGAGKLFNNCLEWSKNNNYKKIISWSDNRWSNGDVYEKLEFTLEKHLMPDYSYVNVKTPYCRHSKQSQRKQNTGCPADKTEHVWALENGFARIWDCGKRKWAYIIQS